MSDPLEPRDEDLVAYWQQATTDAGDPERQARRLAAGVTRFDRRILRRNALEYAACIALLAWSGHKAIQGDRHAVVLFAAVSFVMAFMWWVHRGIDAPDPSADGRAYRDALLHRIDRQIRLLSRVRYWYLLPLYVPVVWTAIGWWHESPAATIVGLVVTTLAFAALAWLNEVVAVGRLRQAKADLEAMFRDES